MNAGPVRSARLAGPTAAVIIMAVVITAAFFPNASSHRAALSPEPDIPGAGQGAERVYGRQFVATEATERGKPHRLPDRTPTFTFALGGPIDINGCNLGGGTWRLANGRFEWVMGPASHLRKCSEKEEAADSWLREFLDRRPRWRLAGDTLKLSSGFGSMTLVDTGAGRDPDDLIGKAFSGWGPLPKADRKPLVHPPNLLRITFAKDGSMRASLGCDIVVADVELNPGWMDVRGELVPRWRTDCSPSMKAQRTDWVWEFLREPLRWQSLQGWLVLKSDSMSINLNYFDPKYHRTDPAAISDLTFRSYMIRGGGAVRAGIEDGRGVTITVRSDGTLTAGVGCDQPTIRGEVRTGWLRFDGQSELAADACTKPSAERWLSDFLSDQPIWWLRSHSLSIRSDQTHMELMDEAEYDNLYGSN